MASQPTASKTHLLLACPRPFSEETPSDPPKEASQESNWGSAVHERVANFLTGQDGVDVAAKWGVDPNELGLAAGAVVAAIANWRSGANDWGLTFKVLGVEVPLASLITLKKGAYKAVTRPVEFDAETHTYDLRGGEIGGTYDLLLGATDGGLRVVLDIKTGEDDWHGGNFAEPKSIDQLMTLAIMTGAEIVGVIHAPRGEPPVIYAAEVSGADKLAFARRLVTAMKMRDSGFIRPGPHCRWCPSRESCPAKDGELLIRASSLVKSVTARPLELPVDLGEFHMLYQEMGRLMGRARDEMLLRVKAGEVHQRPDGTTLGIATKQVRQLSMASITRKLGPQKGAALIADLDALGVIETRTQEELRAVKE